MGVSWGDNPKTSTVIMCGGIPSKRDLEIVAEFTQFLRNRKEGKVSVSPSGTDVGSPQWLNDEWADELNTEEYRDPISEEGSE
jgi:hypothetical protein